MNMLNKGSVKFHIVSSGYVLTPFCVMGGDKQFNQGGGGDKQFNQDNNCFMKSKQLFIASCNAYEYNLFNILQKHTLTVTFVELNFNIEMHSNTEVSGCLGMFGGNSPGHAGQ